MRFAITIAGDLLHAQQVVREHVTREAIENGLAGSDDVVQRPSGPGGQIGKTRHLHVAVFGHRRPQLSDGNVVAWHVHQEHVDGHTRVRSRSDDAVEFARRVEDEPFRHQDQRLRPLHD